ncbi:hypothetical protein J2I47_01080 [Fibrella sp. HMF5335]|uniref:DUF4175 domain-containing protein n=1 Tax=Fibrella rubiginis TaxID=2817060 RepID=A0A939GC87_9BACT|nr:hypothetical protein [Fibrella rubiginis]MBO0935128.1 hypothetical protein [Fibrella rubiginis]
MESLHQLIRSITAQLHANSWLKALLVGASAGLLVGLLPVGLPVLLSIGALVTCLTAWQLGAFEAKHAEAIALLHRTLDQTEYSLPLLTKPDLNMAEQLQLDRLGEQAARTSQPVVVGQHLRPYALLLVGCLTLVGLVNYWPSEQKAAAQLTKRSTKQTAKQTDPLIPPAFQSARLVVLPPAYTGLPTRTTTDLNVTAYVGSVLRWQVQLSQTERVRVALVNSRGGELAFTRQNGRFSYQDRVLNSGLYALRAYWRTPRNRDSLVYQSDFYRLEAQPDTPPLVRPTSKELHRFHRLGEPMQLRIQAQVSDDFQVRGAYIVATLARGSGENVKFRESHFPVSAGPFKSSLLSHTLDLAKLGFTPGDELYYYWAAIDNRQPDPQLTKSDTYFVVFKDTTKTDDAELATMAVNIMPDYFRSQRQIIIDTDKLIAKKKRLTKPTFNSGSNEIGFDQKVLRLRYGQYLGEEFENQIGGHSPMADNDANLLAGYEHRHDVNPDPNGDVSTTKEEHHEEHHAEAGHDHGGANGPATGQEQDPLAAMMEQYVHNHDNGEVNTFYEQSTRSLLKMALEQMWQSELHLRLYEPELARPFEQKALDYLKLAQQKARAYAKKSGYDPPPLKEKETRLTGELKNVANQHRVARRYQNVPVAMLVAEVLGYVSLPKLSSAQRQTVGQLSAALSGPLLQSGLANWSVLAHLQQLASGKPLTASALEVVQSRLSAFANQTTTGSRPGLVSDKKLENAFWQKLE